MQTLVNYLSRDRIMIGLIVALSTYIVLIGLMYWRVMAVRSSLKPGQRLGPWIVVKVDGGTVFLTHATDGLDCYTPINRVYPNGIRAEA